MSIASLFQRLFGKRKEQQRKEQPGNEGSAMPNFDDYIYNDKKADDVTETVALKEKQVSYGALAEEYRILWDTLNVRQSRVADIDAIVDQILQNKPSYDTVSHATHVPWYVVAAIHNLESGLDFSTHLHNGNPLSGYTVDEPAGRPKTHEPPFTWEESAVDALVYDGLNAISDWSIEKIAYHLEAYNGFGYRRHHPNVKSPYLWSFSNHYDKGRYIGDLHWSEESASDQCGAMVLLCQMIARGVIVSPPMDGDAPFAAAAISDLTPAFSQPEDMPVEIEAGAEQPVETDLSDTNANDNNSPTDFGFVQSSDAGNSFQTEVIPAAEYVEPQNDSQFEQAVDPVFETGGDHQVIESTRQEWQPEAERFVSEIPSEPVATEDYASPLVEEGFQNSGNAFVENANADMNYSDAPQVDATDVPAEYAETHFAEVQSSETENLDPQPSEFSTQEPDYSGEPAAVDTSWTPDVTQTFGEQQSPVMEATNYAEVMVSDPVADSEPLPTQQNDGGQFNDTPSDTQYLETVDQASETDVQADPLPLVDEATMPAEEVNQSSDIQETASDFESQTMPVSDEMYSAAPSDMEQPSSDAAPFVEATDGMEDNGVISTDLLEPVELIEPIITPETQEYAQPQQPDFEQAIDAPIADLVTPLENANDAESLVPEPAPAVANPSPEWLETAKGEIGTRDYPGPFYEPRVFAYMQTTMQNPTSDETTWSSAFVNWCLVTSGHSGTNDTNARTWMNYGDILNEPKSGCIVVLWKGLAQSHHGQVGFFDGFEGNRVRVLGAHAADGVDWEEVYVKTYPQERVLGYRWPRDKQNELVQTLAVAPE